MRQLTNKKIMRIFKKEVSTKKVLTAVAVVIGSAICVVKYINNCRKEVKEWKESPIASDINE